MSMLSLSALQIVMFDTSLSAASSTTDLANACIEAAEGEILTALSPRYDVSTSYFQTTTSTPPLLKNICRNIAAGHCYLHLSRGGKDALKRSEFYLKLGRDELQKLVDRKSDLVTSAGVEIDERSDAYQVMSTTDDYKDTFAEDDPLNWAVDSDKLDDIADDRDT